MAPFKPQKSWLRKFKNAARGIAVGIRGQNSFAVHLPVAILVLAIGVICQVGISKLCCLLLCIALVITAELINSSIESLAAAVTDQEDSRIRDSLDIASGAVLAATLFAVIVGLVILLPAIMKTFLSSVFS